jgi:hypothetical protein
MARRLGHYLLTLVKQTAAEALWSGSIGRVVESHGMGAITPPNLPPGYKPFFRHVKQATRTPASKLTLLFESFRIRV